MSNGELPQEELVQEDLLQDNCPICLEPMEDLNEQKITLCEHTFHASCIDRWLSNHNTCPVCRTILFEQQIRTDHQTYLFRCLNWGLCPVPEFRQSRNVRMTSSAFFLLLGVYLMYSFVTSYSSFSNLFKNPWAYIPLIFGTIWIIMMAYELICLLFMCRFETGRVHRLEELEVFGDNIV